MTIKIINDKPYYWLKYEYLLNEFPILGIKSKDVLRRRLKVLVDSGVLDFELVKKGGIFSFYGVRKNNKKFIEGEAKCNTKNIAFTFNSDGTKPYQEFEVQQEYQTVTGKNRIRRETINVLCAYCGRKLEK